MKTESVEFDVKGGAKFATGEQNKKPLIFITPQKRWYDLDWEGIWGRRDLLKLLVLKVIRLRYRQTLLGILWVILQPVMPMLIYTLVFNRWFVAAHHKMPYSIFVYSGLILWLYFTNAVVQSGNSLSAQSHLLRKIYFPRFMLPLSVVIAGTLDFFVGCVLLFGLLLASGFDLHWHLVVIPILFLTTAILALAVGTIFAALSIVYRDVRNILPYLLQLGLFLTPIVYPLENIPGQWHWLFRLNPLTGIIDSFRNVLVGQIPDWNELFVGTVATTGLLIFSIAVFSRMEKYTADYL